MKQVFSVRHIAYLRTGFYHILQHSPLFWSGDRVHTFGSTAGTRTHGFSVLIFNVKNHNYKMLLNFFRWRCAMPFIHANGHEAKASDNVCTSKMTRTTRVHPDFFSDNKFCKWHASLSQAKPLIFRESIVLLKNKTLWAHALGHANPYNRNGCNSASI